ncbi:MAG TPA: chromate transporter [Candidatus Binataceae bacterium]
MNPRRLFHLSAVFTMLGLLAFGGGTAVLPEMQYVTVHTYKWLTDPQFRSIYSLGQISPGPNMLMVLLIGYRLSGAAGAIAVGLAFFIPDCVIALLANRLWAHFHDTPWQRAVQRGLAPIAIGLMVSGTWAIARLSIINAFTLAEAVMVFAILMWRHVNPAVLVIVGGLAYALLGPH